VQDEETKQALIVQLIQTEPRDWIKEMYLHFAQHGWYRFEDLRRGVGDPSEAIEVDPGTLQKVIQKHTP
jgi:hypothetical protein